MSEQNTSTITVGKKIIQRNSFYKSINLSLFFLFPSGFKKHDELEILIYLRRRAALSVTVLLFSGFWSRFFANGII